ncbi:MAG: hypothetical protein KatS3mg129_1032 [Leptospiraceae bacterium]|nr:MAG: hypothetical protein KatS3mg129_1032 [Leptospiraceae bacterium]
MIIQRILRQHKEILNLIEKIEDKINHLNKSKSIQEKDQYLICIILEKGFLLGN